jgi:release factor glutamine methyltransferase
VGMKITALLPGGVFPAKGRCVTTAYSNWGDAIVAAPGVYPPQEDSRLLVVGMDRQRPPTGLRVADLCTGSGFVAVAAAARGALAVTAFDLCPRAVRCARANALAAGVDVDVHLGHWARAAEFGPFDLITSNPPYVPAPELREREAAHPVDGGPPLAVDAGIDGRLVLDPLCVHVPRLLADGGTLLLVQSEFAGIEQTLSALRAAGLRSDIVAHQHIPFGPVMTSRAAWLESTGRLETGRRTERLAVIAAVRS